LKIVLIFLGILLNFLEVQVSWVKTDILRVRELHESTSLL